MDKEKSSLEILLQEKDFLFSFSNDLNKLGFDEEWNEEFHRFYYTNNNFLWNGKKIFVEIHVDKNTIRVIWHYAQRQKVSNTDWVHNIYNNNIPTLKYIVDTLSKMKSKYSIK